MNDVKDENPADSGGAKGYAGPPRSERLRVLLPARRREDWPDEVEGDQPLRRICVLDCETTGLDWTRHSVIEICAAKVLVNSQGRIAAVERLGTALEDPGHPLPPEISSLTGLSDAMLENKRIVRDNLRAFIASCSGVVAYNAAFDRPFIEALLPGLPLMPWACAMADVPWRLLNFEPGPQNYILMQSGKYAADAHRAKDDVLSLIELLDHVCSDGESVMGKVLKAMEGDAWRIEATGAPYRLRELLKDRRYRWRAEGRTGVWHKHIRGRELDGELQWYRDTFGTDPSVIALPATERYRHDRSWKPAERKARDLTTSSEVSLS